MTIAALVILAALVLPMVLAKREPPVESEHASARLPGSHDADSLEAPRVYVSARPEDLWDPWNDYGFVNLPPPERVASFAKQQPAPPTVPTGWGSHSHYSLSATPAERAAQELMDGEVTGWGSHSHFAPDSPESRGKR